MAMPLDEESPIQAVCLNWARTDLCGGRLATAVPTANAGRDGRCGALRRPASESLQWRKPREGIRGPSRGLYGDLSVACELKVT